MSLKVSRILHAGYIFESKNTQIAFDPIFENPFSRNCFAYPNVNFDYKKIKKLKFDAIFISHHHDDHCSFDSLNLIDRNTPIYIYCLFEEMISLIMQLGFNHVYSLELNNIVAIGDMEVIPRRALDSDVDCLLQIKTSELNVLNVVDSWIDFTTLDLLERNGPWDLILWPFQTMQEIEVLSPARFPTASNEIPYEWIEQITKLNPRYIIPSSCQFIHEKWSWYINAYFPISYNNFQMQVESAVPTVNVVRMNPSESAILDKFNLKKVENLNWIYSEGEQNVDYNYNPNLKPPTTLEVSKNFSPLSEWQTLKMIKYCKFEIPNKYKIIGQSKDPFFQKVRFWKLLVYDHKGLATEFNYKLDHNHIEFMTEQNAQLDWLTEVPIAKLYSAVEHGETLTSMYVRINDIIFDKDVEKDLIDVDILEDPLIRCLFVGNFAAYQKVQLLKYC